MTQQEEFKKLNEAFDTALTLGRQYNIEAMDVVKLMTAIREASVDAFNRGADITRKIYTRQYDATSQGS